MSSLSVSNNIEILTQRKLELEKEIYRIEGSIGTFKQILELGIENIDIEKEKEVISSP